MGYERERTADGRYFIWLDQRTVDKLKAARQPGEGYFRDSHSAGGRVKAMVSKLPLSDFRAVRHKLDPDDFALSEGPDIAPTDLIDEETWSGLTHLPDDVAIRTSGHNGVRLKLLHSLWADWIDALGDPHDELFGCMLDATTAFQCANFLYLHGYYRAAMAELRVALELVMIGAYGNLRPTDPAYVVWKTNGSELGFTSFRKKLHGMLRGDQCKWLLANEEFPDKTFRQLCNFSHSRPELKRRFAVAKQWPGVRTRSRDADLFHDRVGLRDLLSARAHCAPEFRLASRQPHPLRGGVGSQSRTHREGIRATLRGACGSLRELMTYCPARVIRT